MRCYHVWEDNEFVQRQQKFLNMFGGLLFYVNVLYWSMWLPPFGGQLVTNKSSGCLIAAEAANLVQFIPHLDDWHKSNRCYPSHQIGYWAISIVFGLNAILFKCAVIWVRKSNMMNVCLLGNTICATSMTLYFINHSLQISCVLWTVYFAFKAMFCTCLTECSWASLVKATNMVGCWLLHCRFKFHQNLNYFHFSSLPLDIARPM